MSDFGALVRHLVKLVIQLISNHYYAKIVRNKKQGVTFHSALKL
jgi:hypothetical protein